MISFGQNIISGINKIFLEFRMLEKHVKRLGYEPTTVLDYSKPLSDLTYASELERTVHWICFSVYGCLRNSSSYH